MSMLFIIEFNKHPKRQQPMSSYAMMFHNNENNEISKFTHLPTVVDIYILSQNYFFCRSVREVVSSTYLALWRGK